VKTLDVRHNFQLVTKELHTKKQKLSQWDFNSSGKIQFHSKGSLIALRTCMQCLAGLGE